MLPIGTNQEGNDVADQIIAYRKSGMLPIVFGAISFGEIFNIIAYRKSGMLPIVRHPEPLLR